ncbi:allophanate hydrolase subunit 1 [Sedimentitalea sp. JM2-8]|uniref:Allophanate hydrolase subunit 1 n=1 Tax=Sedimentitalea xiamensis TaxID=3050037 RepID=A0ABT7FHD1_9RHOB|nr:allophanate hydrolase subunit 1 [Sedimentitalea xiamensis]MDK3074488.1 allophanate hydrolase subunit 1 [Sedimentitalea xiamensis]
MTGRARAEQRFPCFSPVAEHGLLVEFGETIDRETNARVRQLDEALAADPFDGFLESVPAYASLLIHFDPLICDHGSVRQQALRRIGGESRPDATPGSQEVLVCYDGDFAPDLEAVATACGLSRDDVIAAHLAGRYDVFMYGFAPGYAYLGGVPDRIRLPRKPVAVRDVPAGSVLIAGPQCLVSTLTMPTGWWIIGRSPTRILTQDESRPFLFDVGDRVRFRRIGRTELEAGVVA